MSWHFWTRGPCGPSELSLSFVNCIAKNVMSELHWVAWFTSGAFDKYNWGMSEILGCESLLAIFSWVIELGVCWASFSQQQVLPAGFSRHPDWTEQKRDLLKICLLLHFLVSGLLSTAKQVPAKNPALLWLLLRKDLNTNQNCLVLICWGPFYSLKNFWIACIHSAQ